MQLDAAAPVLSAGTGYGIVVGLGLAFAVLMAGIAQLTARYSEDDAIHSSEEYTSASHNVKPGLLASGIVSAATWAATLLNSATVCVAYGISGPYWYGAGSATQIMLFAQNAVMLKRNAPGAHTFLEIIAKRWGTVPHLCFILVGLGTNIILTAQLITGGSTTVNALTGMNVIAACFLIPLGVVLYTLIGGLRATFFSDYIHTTLIFAIILAFSFTTYAAGDDHGILGSPRKVYELLQEAAINYPVADNAAGSYTTFRSINGLVFGIIVIISGIATVFMDQTYWQRAVAGRASVSVEGYLLGGFSFLPVPWGFATAAGLAIVALSGTPTSPFSFLTPAEFGLVAPAAATALLGASGARLLLVVLFLAVTSAASAELVAVSSICVYDIYKRYFVRNPTDKELLFVSHVAVVAYGVVMALLGVIFYEIGISLGWLYGFTGTWGGAAVAPVCMAVRVRKASKWGCFAGLWVGFACGIAAWLVTAKKYSGILDVASTGTSYSQLAGNAASLLISTGICVLSTLFWPDRNFDFDALRAPDAFSSRDTLANSGLVFAGKRGGVTDDDRFMDDKDPASVATVSASAAELEIELNDAKPEELKSNFVKACWATGIAFVVLCIIVPAIACCVRVWSESGFAFYVAVTIIWTFLAAFIVIIYPIWESRAALAQVAVGFWRDPVGRQRKV